MPREIVVPGGSGAGAPPFSKVVRAGDFVYVSGQVPFDENGKLVEGGIEDQTRQVMANIKALLAEAGCTMDDVVKCTCWLDDARDFGRFNAVYREAFGDTLPARSCTEARLMIDTKVEVEAIAYKPKG